MKMTFLATAAVVASSLAVPSLAQAACAQYDPGCQTYQTFKSDSGTSGSAAARTEARTDAGTHHRYRSAYRQDRSARREAVNDRAYYNGRPGDIVGGAIGTAGAVAAGAVNTAGAIATAPFRAADSYAYYNNDHYGWHDDGWYGRSYAERNGFVCTPGTYVKGADGRTRLCQ